MSHELPKETNVQLLAPSSPSQKQDSPAQFAEQFNANSPNGEDTSCDAHMVSERSEGDSYEQLCSHPQNLLEESDDELQPLSRVYPLIFHLDFLDCQWRRKSSDILSFIVVEVALLSDVNKMVIVIMQ